MDIDISETKLRQSSREILNVLLTDRTTGRRLRWGTEDYCSYGVGYASDDPISIDKIVDLHGDVIRPRVLKSLESQSDRTRERAEVFTAAWICNEQNNLVDSAWFGGTDVFNTGNGQEWVPSEGPVLFPEGRTWKDYVLADRMEVSVGEAPYLTSRYDAVSGEPIPVIRRIGILDRKLRIVSENASSTEEWMGWSLKALQSTYGFDLQGDNVLLARENLLSATAEYYEHVFGAKASHDFLLRAARVIAWNIWQMDGLTYTVPNSCKPIRKVELLLTGERVTSLPCPGCAEHKPLAHTGIYCMIRDWKKRKKIRFADLVCKKGGNDV